MKLYRFLHDHVESIPDGLLCLLCFSVGQHRVHLNKHCLVEDREEHPSQCTVVLDVLLKCTTAVSQISAHYGYLNMIQHSLEPIQVLARDNTVVQKITKLFKYELNV